MINHSKIDHITIRAITLKDALKRHEFFIKLSEEQIGVIHTIDEIDYHSETSRMEIMSFLHNHKGLWLIALDKEDMVGEIDVTIKNLSRLKHNGYLTIGILPSHQNIGLGHKLMHEAIAWSKAQGLRRLEVSVISSNIKALKFYQRHGFSIDGIKKNAINENNTFIDDIFMSVNL
jgi:ribosomal protein S18 acetylase RimI-like enzyme